MTKRQLAGQKGGLKTASLYGKEYMREIASRGGSYRLPTIIELRLINNQKGGKSTAVIKTESGEIIRSKHLVKTVGAAV